MPYRHAAQQLIEVGELRADPLAHSPIGPAMLEAVRAIALQVSRIEEGLHQGVLHDGAERKQALEALQKDMGGLNRRLQVLTTGDITRRSPHDWPPPGRRHASPQPKLDRRGIFTLGMDSAFSKLEWSLVAIKTDAIHMQMLISPGSGTAREAVGWR